MSYVIGRNWGLQRPEGKYRWENPTNIINLVNDDPFDNDDDDGCNRMTHVILFRDAGIDSDFSTSTFESIVLIHLK